ncbi:hypothetical protein F0562_012128 [Nyssa sinensis]|uniref:Uncharacterized protein n=1 Tax=Nyssa sinensis TaxID=561372 RepID=A0A5J4ZVL7_9ASTE|nr:hypothetical protein F0562_012128 [Nyssa sinensis]
MQSQRHLGPVVADVAVDREVDTVEVRNTIPNEDCLVDQTPPQYYRDPTPPRLFYCDPGASSSSDFPPPITRGDLEEYFQQLWMDLFISVLQELSTHRTHIQTSPLIPLLLECLSDHVVRIYLY